MKEIELDQEIKSIFIRTLISTVKYQRASTTSEEHLKELLKIEEMAKNLIINDKDVVLELTESFYDTWVLRTFKEVFLPYNRFIDRIGAKKLNRLYFNLFGEDNEDFLTNYTAYPNR